MTIGVNFHIKEEMREYYGNTIRPETLGSSGIDLRSRENTVELEPGERALLWSGLYIEVPCGFEIQVRPRSGLSLKKGITVLNTPGTIDSDWQGELGAILINLSQQTQIIEPGERMAQAVICQVETPWCDFRNFYSLDGYLENFKPSERGTGGFGSTGTH